MSFMEHLEILASIFSPGVRQEAKGLAVAGGALLRQFGFFLWRVTIFLNRTPPKSWARNVTRKNFP